MQEDAVRLLLIAGNPDTRDALSALLQAARPGGFSLETTSPLQLNQNGLDQYDLLLLDFPGIGDEGPQALPNLCSNPANPPVLLLTGEQHLRSAREAVRMGARDYLVLDCLDASQLERSLQLSLEARHGRTEPARQAQLDPATGLPNQHGLHAAIQRLIDGAHQERQQFALFLIELKADQASEAGAWGQMLQATARRLGLSLRRGDSLARPSHSSFAVLVQDIIGTGELALITRKLIATITQPIPWEGQPLQPQCSVGVAVYPEGGEQREALLESARSALNEAAQQPGSQARIFSPASLAPERRHASLAGELRRAIRREELELYYQPRISLREGRVIAVEALLRWRHPELGLLLPKDFLALAENSGMILPLGYQLIQRALADIEQMDQWGLPPLPVALNLSCRQLLDESFIPTLTRLLHNSEASTSRLQFELKETAACHGTEAIGPLKELAALGVTLALDDFGAGSTPLPLLQQYPVQALCLDRHFVRNMDKSEDDRALLKALIGLAHGLGMKAIAKGAEEPGHVDQLQALGCDEVQGHYFSPAVDLNALAVQVRRLLHESA